MASWQDYMVTSIDETRELAWVSIYDDADSFFEENMKTGPGEPLSAIDVEEEELYLNGEEYWSLVSGSLEPLETASSRLGFAWESHAGAAPDFGSAEGYASYLERSGLDTRILDTGALESILESSEPTGEEFGQYVRPDRGYNRSLDDLR